MRLSNFSLIFLKNTFHHKHSMNGFSLKEILSNSRSLDKLKYTFVVRMTIIGDDTAWSVTYDRHSDDSRVVVYDRNLFVTVDT